MGFDEALKIAQELGYAERDPSADVEGHDTCRKICILASLAFGRHVYPEGVHTEGITKITLEDVKYCESMNSVIKLIGFAAKRGDDVAIMTCPAVINEESQLAGVNDVFNAILVRSDATGDVVFYGKGAGKLPTASAVVADITNALKTDHTSKTMSWKDSSQEFVIPFDRLSNRFYVRAQAERKDVESIFGEVRFLSRDGAPDSECAFVTAELGEKEFAEKCEKLNVLGTLRVLDY